MLNAGMVVAKLKLQNRMQHISMNNRNAILSKYHLLNDLQINNPCGYLFNNHKNNKPVMQKLLNLFFISVMLAFQATAQFTNVTEEALGNPPTAVAGRESIAWPDVNNDGWPDLFVGSKYLYINQGDGTFILQDPAVNGFEAMGSVWFARASFADADNDGDLDCVQSSYYGNSTFYFENNGPPDYYFSDTVIYLHEPSVFGGQPTFFNADDDLEYEVYLSMVGSWEPYAIGKDRLFDLAGNVWTDITAEKIPELELSAFKRPARGSVACDYDNDFDMDMFVPVYGISTAENHANLLWQNDGNGNFTDVAAAAGVAIEPNSNYGGLASGASWGDFNNDGLFDLAVANIHGRAALYKNNGDGTFDNVSAEAGIHYWNFEWHNTLFLDYDNDGDLDLFFNQWYNNYNAILFRNDGPENLGHFTDVTYQLGFTPTTDLNYVTGWACADYDRDGDLDLAYYNASDLSKGVYLWRNDIDNDNHWLVMRLVGNGTTVNQNALGAKARLFFEDGAWTPVKQVEASSADQGMNMHPIHMGLGEKQNYEFIKVDWPDGNTEYFPSSLYTPHVDAWIDVIQGTGSHTIVSDNRQDSKPMVYALNGNIIVQCKHDLLEVSVYDLYGKQVIPPVEHSSQSPLFLDMKGQTGMYIVSGMCQKQPFASMIHVP
ncbi:MAG: hypothetical protein AVO34_06345 [Firmicutes bacterium ML8_F2]|nr:MAG: hypothetical protein AVO34_06345 [Firmicutes bacterium ML8_F2]